ncbi:MAG TPA: FAD-dependent monooxygenase [Bacteroidia bacterium]|jgi:flavin-dependent dehydrogenase|nr:FAD-dependent monooxygenase [Bacteroidia bacterium]
METKYKTYQCAIIGGGLAGLCLAIQLADKGISIVLFEKNKYPFHKVCGEYISMESWNFLTELGLPLADLNLPQINELGISSENGFMLNAPLKMGGFGISRYSLDNYLVELARKKNVTIFDNCKVFDVQTLKENNYQINTSLGLYNSTIICGTYGKYTPTFVKDDVDTKPNKLNYIGVKYHIKTSLKPNRIELHNFKDGYCGVSKVDKDAYCLCYLSTSKNLQECGNDIKKMEETILYKNPFLKKYFTESEFVFDAPLVISNISFQKKDTYKNSFFLAGDAAGSITPLCGNGMSMAMRASKILAQLLISYFNKSISKEELIKRYDKVWNENFNTRIKSGYYLQHLFGKKNTTHYTLKVLDQLPSLTKKIISLTHGEIF